MELINQFDETFNFEDKEIRVLGSYKEPFFVAKDICDILGLSNITNALRSIPDKWMTLQNVKTSYNSQNMIMLSEPAVYKLIMRSNKLIAQKFQEVVCEEILPSLRKKGEYKIQSIIDKNKELEDEKLRIEEEKLKVEDELKIKAEEIKKLEDKILNKKNRKVYKDKNCIYILSSSIHMKDRIYIIGQSVDLRHRLSAYNKTLEHDVIYTKGCKSKEHMNIIEKMILLKLDKYREKANRDRFILPNDKDISLFTDTVNKAIEWFDDIEEYVHIYQDDEIGMTNEELQKKFTEDIIVSQENLKIKKSETDRLYRENNKEMKAENDKLYRENNLEKIANTKKIHYEENKTEILKKQKEYYEENKYEIIEKQKEYRDNNKEIIKVQRKNYRDENKDKIKDQKKIYREKYKEKINIKQNEKRKEKDNPIIECACGVKLKLMTSKSKKHINSFAHKKFLEEQNEYKN
jgi:prophage antirepressor-like protein